MSAIKFLGSQAKKIFFLRRRLNEDPKHQTDIGAVLYFEKIRAKSALEVYDL